MKLVKLLVMILSGILITSCTSKDGNGTYACSGDLTEIHTGPLVRGGEQEYKFKEQIALEIKDSRVILTGATQLAISQLLLKNGPSKNGYEFVICKRKDHEIEFNNFDCDFSIIPPNFPFDIYVGTFNGINGQLTLQRRPKVAWNKLMITQDLIMACKPTKPIF